ncbi:GD20571 [Drosophila simulans]|uniref:DNA ligase n=1 Tax=Drosophila simulans TaxID=7240 RepID=B4QSV9_DROSI|nr:GD20571 [Drosophila simulans]
MASKGWHNEDNKLDTFRRICDEIAGESSYLKKAEKLQRFFEKGSSGKGFKGDTLLWVQFLIPAANQRVYNLQNKALIKLFSRIFNADQQQMHLDLEQDGDVSETLRKHFAASKKLKPQAQSKLYLQEVEEMLLKLVERTKEDEQTDLLQKLCSKATDLDLRTFIRLVKHDLRINARARHILDAFGPDAYPTYQSSRDLVAIVGQFAGKENKKDASSAVKKVKKTNSSGIQVMTPISPMLASPCKSVEEAFKKSPTGLYSEIKYDGERVQIHKQGNDFKFFSRNLKPVVDHKIRDLKKYIPLAFPGGGKMILDSEIILVDTDTGALLPFGSLGAHKKHTFTNAAVCLFVFDCILYDGEDLTQL